MIDLFCDNKYTRIYYSIINTSKKRKLERSVYVEKHHILPKSLGGDNSISNIASLTAREHFLCHLLLIKMCKDKESMIKMRFALNSFRRTSKNQNRIKLTSRQYELIRKEVSKARSEFLKGNKYNLGKSPSLETRKKISISNKGKKKKPLTTAHKQKISLMFKGMPKSETFKEKMRKPKPDGFGQKLSKSRTGVKIHTSESKLKISKSWDDDRRNKQKEINLKMNTKEYICPYCQLVGKGPNMKRYHYDNCKQK